MRFLLVRPEQTRPLPLVILSRSEGSPLCIPVTW